MHILFVAPDNKMAELARTVSKEYPLDIEVEVGLLQQAIPIARKYESKAEVLITRGGTVSHLRKAGITTPIVELYVTGQDIADSITRAQEQVLNRNPKIAVITFKNMIHSFDAFTDLLKINVICEYLTTGMETTSVITSAVARGAEVLIGGVITTQIARRMGLKAVEIRSGETSIRQAIQQAEELGYARRLEQRRSKEIAAILETSHDGIISVNGQGRIQVVNRAACRLLGLSKDSITGSLCTEIAPSLKLKEALDGAELRDNLCTISSNQLLVNTKPLTGNDRIFGAVSSFQDVTIIQESENRIRRKLSDKGLAAKFTFNDIIGESEEIKTLIETARSFAETDSSIIISGESGVGKELFAQSIHNASSRCREPFVGINCAALPENLIESELFGYAPGAFTGASKRGKLGLFELAHGGTIFLDEVSEIPLHIQGRLLRVLQEREVMRVGDDRVIPINVRVICASNKSLWESVTEGKFRNDLFWRLNILQLGIPPLRRRKKDIPILLESFLRTTGNGRSSDIRIDKSSMEMLQTYDWPGNIRELRNFCERLSVCFSSGVVDCAVASKLLAVHEQSFACEDEEELRIRDALDQARGNKSKAAEILGMHRTTLWRKLREYHLS